MPRLSPFEWLSPEAGPWPGPVSPVVSPLPARAEHVVIGGGLTGWACALHLAVAGREVVVLDRAFGGGATRRSGGIVVGGTLIGPAPGFDGCEDDLREWVERYGVAGGLEWRGVLELDRNADLPATPIDWCDAGVVRSSGVVPGGTLDPSALLTQVAAEAVKHGARFVDGFSATGLSIAGTSIAVESKQIRVLASRVLVATDATGTADHFDPWPVRRMTVALQTTPLSDDQAASLGWRERQPFYTNDLPLLWGRGLPGGGMIAGRELIDIDGLSHAELDAAFQEAGARLIARVRGLHPAARTLDVVRIWAGPIARNDQGIPAIYADPAIGGAFWAGGYGGHGLAPAFRLGAVAARRMIER